MRSNSLFAGLGRVDVAVLESGRGGKRTARRGSGSRKLCRRRPRGKQTLRLCSERCGGGGGGGGLAVAPGMLCEPLEALPKNSRGRHCVLCGRNTGSQRVSVQSVVKENNEVDKVAWVGVGARLWRWDPRSNAARAGTESLEVEETLFETWTWQSAPRVARVTGMGIQTNKKWRIIN